MSNKLLRNSVVAVLVGVGLAAIGAAAAWKNQSGEQEGTSADHTKSSEHAPHKTVAVRVFQVGSRSASQTGLAFTGTVRARYERNAAFRVPGKIVRRLVEVGDQVKAGQTLFELDTEDYQLQHKSAAANLDVARAALQQASAEEKRLYELTRSNAVSRSEYDRGLSERDIAQGRLEAAEKQLELAANQLDYCVLKSDYAGVITSVDAEAGQVVAAGVRVCGFAEGGELEAVVDIPENRLPKQEGLEPRVSFWSLPDQGCTAKLRELSPTADPLTRTFRARFTLLNASPEVRLGMTATVHWELARRSERFAVPATSVFKRGDQPAVWRVVAPESGERRIELVNVALEQLSDDSVVVSGGLKEGDLIVSAGVQKLDAGLHVRIWESQK
ncbi:MAG: efflux RND transporter periplasmic adaptor subunit [Pirellulales bacterium]